MPEEFARIEKCDGFFLFNNKTVIYCSLKYPGLIMHLNTYVHAEKVLMAVYSWVYLRMVLHFVLKEDAK